MKNNTWKRTRFRRLANPTARANLLPGRSIASSCGASCLYQASRVRAMPYSLTPEKCGRSQTRRRVLARADVDRAFIVRAATELEEGERVIQVRHHRSHAPKGRPRAQDPGSS